MNAKHQHDSSTGRYLICYRELILFGTCSTFYVKSLPTMPQLPPDLMELQLAQIELLQSMYPEEDSIQLDDNAQQLIAILKEWCASGTSESAPIADEKRIQISLRHDIYEGDVVEMNIFFPLLYSGHEVPLDPPSPVIKLQQPHFMKKADVAELNADIEERNQYGGQLDLLSAIGMIEDVCSAHLAASQLEAEKKSSTTKAREPLSRVWFYFPSISTREKRDDLINHAPSYGFTGFLLAGKPGFLCVEGGSKAIDDYMKFIKTESWGDIPAHHKKVSERYRESGSDVQRRFEDMREVTDEVGERRGERANRTDMRALEAWLGERGFGDVMRKLVI